MEKSDKLWDYVPMQLTCGCEVTKANGIEVRFVCDQHWHAQQQEEIDARELGFKFPEC